MKPLLLFQRTPFCQSIQDRLRLQEKFRNRFQFISVPISTISDEKRALADRIPRDLPILLVWGDGTNHHFSNLLNIPGSTKRVWDAHTDIGAISEETPLDFENHNSFSAQEGVILRICNGLDRRGQPYYSVFDDRPGNGLLHLSVDLDIMYDFPSLGWMSKGNMALAQLLDQIRNAATEGKRLVRVDIGGFSEDPKIKDWFVYQKYYRPLIEEVANLFEMAQ